MNTKIILFVTVTALLIAACSASAAQTPETAMVPTVIADTKIIAEGRLEPVHYADIAFSATGIVSEVSVKVGDTVRKGERLIRLGDTSNTQYASAELELASARQALDDLMGAHDTDLAQAEIDLKEAQDAFKKAENYLKYLTVNEYVPQTVYTAKLVSTGRGWEYKYETKNTRGPAPKEWIVDAANDLALKKAKLAEAQHLYDRMKDGPDTEKLPLLEARVKAAEAELAAFVVSAPFDGVVADVHAKVGGSINAGETAVTIADFSSWLVKTTDLTEIDIVKIKEGQPVKIMFDALPGVEFKGNITSIGQTYSQNQGDVVYEVTVLLARPDPAMRWGMTAVVEFTP